MLIGPLACTCETLSPAESVIPRALFSADKLVTPVPPLVSGRVPEVI